MGFLDNLFGKKEEKKPVDDNWVKACLYAKLGEEQLGKEKYNDAITAILSFFELKNKYNFPDLDYMEVPCYFNLAAAYKYLAVYEKAIFFISKCIAKDPNNYEAYRIRIQANFELENMTEAISDINAALRIKPNSDEMLMNKGIAFLKVGDYSQAKDALLKAKKLGNEEADFYINQYL